MEKVSSHGQGSYSAEEREVRVMGDSYGLWGERRSEKLVRSVVGLEVCRGMQNPPLEEPKRRV